MRGHQLWYRRKFVRLMECAGSTVVGWLFFLQKEVCEVGEMCGVTRVGTERSLWG